MLEIYCDESRQDLFYNRKAITENNKYIFIGGIMIGTENRKEIKNNINNLKLKYNLNINLEIKWNRVTKKYIDFYKELIDLYFDSDIYFRTICIDSSKLNLKKYHNDNAELGFYKFYYQLLNNWLKINDSYIIYTDIKTSSDPNVLKNLMNCLNNKKKQNIVKKIYAIESYQSVFLQLEDLIMGITSYKLNFGYNGTSNTKLELIEYLEERLGHKIVPTSKNAIKYNLFEIKL